MYTFVLHLGMYRYMHITHMYIYMWREGREEAEVKRRGEITEQKKLRWK